MYIVPHSHYDAIWIFNKQDNLDINCNYIIKKAIEILKKEKDFKFIIEQTYLIEYIENNYPELFSEIKNFVKEGRIEIAGGEYLMSDAMLPSGEVTIREIMEGKSYVREKFGKEVTVFWGADEFGYNAQLPQVLIECGYKYFVFRRGVTDPLKSEFYWKGIDGTKILSHWMPLGYRAGLELSLLHQTFLHLQKQASTKHILMPSGSGSTPPQPELCKTVHTLNESSKSSQSDDQPYMMVSTPSEFFNALEQELKENNISIPIKNGEFYSGKTSFVFPDVTSTRSWIKQGFKEYETCLLMFERWSTVLKLISNDADYSDELKKYWKQAMFFAMHDSLPGTGIDMVYEEMRDAFNKLDNTLRKSLNECLKKIVNILTDLKENSHYIVAFNSVSWEVDDWVEVDVNFAIEEVYEILGLKASDGQVIDVDILDCELHEKDKGIKTARIGFIAKLPPMGFFKYEIIFRKKDHHGGNTSQFPIISSSTSHETQFNFEDYSLEMDAETGIFSLFQNDRLFLIGNNLRIEEELGDLYYHRDTTGIIKSESGEGVFFGVFKKEKYYVLNGKIRTKIVYQSKYYAIRWPYRLTDKLPPVIYEHGFITVRKEVFLYKGQTRIDCVTHIDNKHPHIRLRMEFDVPFKGYTYWSGTQFGAICRPTNLFYLTKDPDVSKKWAEIPNGVFPSFEWIDFSNKEQDIGITLTHFGIPSHEIRDNSIYLTLLRGVETLSADGSKGPVVPTPDAAEKKQYTFKYSIIPHSGDWRDNSSYKQGALFNMKPIVFHITKEKNSNNEYNNNNHNNIDIKNMVSTDIELYTGEADIALDYSNSFSFIEVLPKNVLISTIKLPQSDTVSHNKIKDIILRIYETEGRSVVTKILFYYPVKSVSRLNLLEQPKKEDTEFDKQIIFESDRKMISLPLSPYKIVTLKVEFDI